MSLSFAELCSQPPMRQEPLTLEDGREVTLHELPIGVMADIQSVAGADGGDHDITRTIARVAAQSLLGRVPTEDELRQFSECFGASQVMRIYYQALKLSSLSEDAVGQEKKD